MLGYGLLVFIAPIIIALLSWGVVAQFTGNSAIQAASAFGGFALCLFCVAIYSKKVSSCRCDVEIVEILTKENQ